MAGRRQRGGLFTSALALLGLGIGALALWPRAGEGPDPASEGDAATATTTEGAKPGGLDARPAALAAAPARPDAHGFGRPTPVPDGTAIVGIVVDEAGRGVGGARVVAIPDTLSSYQTIDKFGAEGAGGAENFTREDGRFAVEAAGDAPLYVVVAQVRGHPLTVAKGVRVGDDVRLVLGQGLTVSGRVLTKEGDPIEGARVTALTTLDLVVVEETARSAADGTYRVTGLPVWPGEGLESLRALRAEKEGFASVFVDTFGRPVAGERDAFELDLVLVRGATLTGVVVEHENGRPVEGARVVAWSAEGNVSVLRPAGGYLRHPWSGRVFGEVVSGPDGTFRFEHLPARGFHRAAAPSMGRRGILTGYVSARTSGTTWASDEIPLVEDGQEVASTLRLSPAASVTGRVLLPDGSPAAGVSVWSKSSVESGGGAMPPPGPARHAERAQMTTGADGTYRLVSVPASAVGSCRIQVFAHRTSEPWSSSHTPPSVETDVVAGEEAKAPDLTLGAVKGVPVLEAVVLLIRDEAGAPIGGATWALTASAYQPIHFSDGPRRSGRDGRLPLSVMGKAVTIVLRAPGFGSTVVALPAGVPPGTEVPVVLPSPHRVAGRVVDPQGVPVASARVTVYDGSAALETLFPKDSGFAFIAPAGATYLGYGGVNQDGAFVIGDLPAGPYHVVAHGVSRSTVGGAAPRAVRSGVPSDAIDLMLTLPLDARPVGGRIVGSIVDEATGRVIARAEVTAVRRRGADDPPEEPFIRRGPGGQSIFFTGPRVSIEWLTPGTFEVSNTEVGTYDLTVRATGYAPVSLVAEVPAGRDVTLAQTVLSRGVRLHGEVRWPEGASSGDRTLTLVAAEPVGPGSSAEVAASTPLPAQGRYVLTGLRPGRYRVMASPAGFGGRGVLSSFLRESDVPVVIAEGVRDVEVDLVFAVAGSLTLQCDDPRLPPVSGLGGSEATDEQKAFGRGSSLTVYDAAGRVLAETRSLETGIPWSMLRLMVLPGPCVVRLRLPSGETFEERADVIPGVDTSVAIGSGTRPPR